MFPDGLIKKRKIMLLLYVTSFSTSPLASGYGSLNYLFSKYLLGVSICQVLKLVAWIKEQEK